MEEHKPIHKAKTKQATPIEKDENGGTETKAMETEKTSEEG